MKIVPKKIKLFVIVNELPDHIILNTFIEGCEAGILVGTSNSDKSFSYSHWNFIVDDTVSSSSFINAYKDSLESYAAYDLRSKKKF